LEPVEDFVKTSTGVHKYHDRLAMRKANSVIARAALGDLNGLLDELKYRSDPSVRSYVIDRLGPSGVDLKLVLDCLDRESDLGIRTALVLSLGGFDLSTDARRHAAQKVEECFADNDAGLHSAAEWVLRKWELLDGVLKRFDRFATRTHETIANQLPKVGERPTWCMSQGHTMIIIPPCSKFQMGSPPEERGRQEGHAHDEEIPYYFAISAHPVTWGQFTRFTPFEEFVKTLRADEGDNVRETVEKYKLDAEDPTDEVARFYERPVNFIEWHMAARYCESLNEEEKLGKSFNYYEMPLKEGGIARRTDLVSDYLTSVRYRLPTEREMEYATRANTTTARFYGNSDHLLEKYAWYAPNAGNSTHPVGLIKPNEFGLFDVQGNVSEWCENFPRPKDENGNEDNNAVLRGGMFFDQWSDVRSAYGYRRSQDSIMNFTGFRIAKTIAVNL
jgi:formylglycine-generating enzyme required for sulfatase activity